MNRKKRAPFWTDSELRILRCAKSLDEAMDLLPNRTKAAIFLIISRRGLKSLRYSYEYAFWSKVPNRPSDPRKCWIWVGDKYDDGYGRFRRRRAHRVACELSGRKIPKHLHGCHSCDVRLCVRPSHIVSETQKWNVHDAIRKGRLKLNGEDNPRSKLNLKIIESIRNEYALGNISQRPLGKKYGVSQPHIHRILHGERWPTAPLVSRQKCAISIAAKRNGAPGESNPNAKLTMEEVSTIRSRYSSGGISARELGRKYGVDKSVIVRIVNGKSWRVL